MSTLKVEILNPKAAKLLKDLADMNLIAINKFLKTIFLKLLPDSEQRRKSHH
ncbi:hypothetical protein ACPPVU_08685 [Mucilaginibacter sp. McL0603]|uniref:hypothetical protein n=1 Tax=Mucilaginibacter sp. McL0603 TaxID=3415670 RepID=UPI003CF8B805